MVIASVDGQTPAAVNPGEVQSPPPTSRADDADTIQAGTGASFLVGGTTASNIDTSDKLATALPIFVVVVVG